MREAIVKASEGHRAFGKLLKRVFRSDEHLIVERDGYPVAVLLSYEEYAKLKGERGMAAFEQFSRNLGRDLEQQGVTEEEMLATVREAKQQVYDEQYGG